MKKRILILSALFILVFTMSAQALEPRTTTSKPILSFSGMTAYCAVECAGESTSDEVKATLTLYQGTTYVDSWSGSGKGCASLSGSCKVMRGKTYKLVLTYSVNGNSKPSVFTTGSCP